MGYEVIPFTTAVKPKNPVYGVDFSFNSAGVFSPTLSTVKQVRANLKNLLLTRTSERYMQPEFGCRLFDVLFEPNTEDLKPFIQETIFQAVQKWMPYLSISVDIVTADDDPSLTDSIKVIVTGIVDNIALDEITVFASPNGIAVS